MEGKLVELSKSLDRPYAGSNEEIKKAQSKAFVSIVDAIKSDKPMHDFILSTYKDFMSSEDYMKAKALEREVYGYLCYAFGYNNVHATSSVSANTATRENSDIDFTVTYDVEATYKKQIVVVQKPPIKAKFIEVRGKPGESSEHRVWQSFFEHGGKRMEIEVKFRQEEMVKETLKAHVYIDEKADYFEKAVVAVLKDILSRSEKDLYKLIKKIQYNHFALLAGSAFYYP